MGAGGADGGEPVSDVDLRVRADDLFQRATPFLLNPVALSEQDDLAAIDAKVAYLVAQARAWLAAAGEDVAAIDVLRVSHALSDAHTLRWDIRGRHIEERQRRFAVLDRALSDLRSERDPDVLLDQVSQAILDACGFDRVLVSRVDGDTWRPWRSRAREVRPEEATFADWLREAPTLHLDPRIREGESVGRRQAVIVFPDDEADRMARPFVRARPGSPGRRPGGSYVAAPLAPSDDVVGLIHADYVDRDVTQLDREILAAFARAFDQIYERAVLLWRLHNERTLIAESLDHVQRVLAEVASTEIALVHRAEEAVTRRTDAGLSAVNRASATSELAAVLTGRELEVLAQMATGATNDRIAQELSISRDTVKSHVTHILRKLGAENRGEAIAHYLRLTMGSL